MQNTQQKMRKNTVFAAATATAARYSFLISLNAAPCRKQIPKLFPFPFDGGKSPFMGRNALGRQFESDKNTN